MLSEEQLSKLIKSFQLYDRRTSEKNFTKPSDLKDNLYNVLYRLGEDKAFMNIDPKKVIGKVGIYGDKIVRVEHPSIEGRLHIFEKDYFGNYVYKGDEDQPRAD